MLSVLPRILHAMRHSYETRILFSRRFSTSLKLSNSVIDAYREKLAFKAAQQGMSVEELMIEAKKNTRSASHQSTATSKMVSASSESNSRVHKPETSYNIKPLKDILVMDAVIKESPENISKLWTVYHSTRNCISGVIPSDIYSKLMERGSKYPLFILPLPRDEGVEFHLLQFSGLQIYFTPLIAFQTHKENAVPELVITHYTDLQSAKGIILMKGEVTENSSISLTNAQTLMYQLQLYYVTGGLRKFELVERFHSDPKNFEYQWLLDEIERLDVSKD